MSHKTQTAVPCIFTLQKINTTVAMTRESNAGANY